MTSTPIRYIPDAALLVCRNTHEILEINKMARNLFSDLKRELEGCILKEHIGEINLEQGEYHNILFRIESGEDLRLNMSLQEYPETKKPSYIATFRQSESQFLELMNGSVDGIIITDRKLNILEVNPAFTTISGITPEEVVGFNGSKLVMKYSPSEALGSVMAGVKKMLSGESVSSFDIKFRGKIIAVSTEIKKGTPLLIGIIRDVTEEREARLSMMESEEKFRILAESTFEGIVIHNKGFVLDVNESFQKMTGFSREEAIGKNMSDYLVKPIDRAKVLADILRKKVKPYHVLARKKDGSTFTVEIESKGMSLRGKKLRISAIRNVSSHLSLQEQLRESESRYRAVFQNTGTAICIIEEDRTISLANSRFASLTGYLEEDIENKMKWPQLVSESDQERMIQWHHQRRLDPDNTPKNYEFTLVSRQGNFIRICLYINLIPGTDQSIASLIDITEMKNAESQMRLSEQFLQSLFRAAPVGIGVMLNRHFKEVNQMVCEITGYEKEELLDQPSRMVYLTDEDHAHVGKVKYGQTSKQGTGAVETRWRCKDGSFKDILLQSTPLNTKNLEDGVTFTALDITSRKQTERDLLAKNQELVEAKDRAEESDRLKTSFLANMSHEIRTPMNGILGFTDLLRNPNLSAEDRKTYMDIIEKSGQRLMGTVNDLIDISKLETGQLKTVITDTPVYAQMENLYNFFRPEAEEKKLQFTMHKELAGDRPIVRTDDNKLHSILSNLLKNAMKYTDEGSINFGCKQVWREGSSMLQFYVSDTGIGIPKNKWTAVFKRFEQADLENRKAYEGSGLGLTIAKNLVELLGGEIWLESEENTGTTFFFTIPNVLTSEYQDPLVIDTKQISKPVSLDANIKILIAEDDIASFLYLKTILREIPSNIIHVKTGLEAVRVCKENSDIDLVLMDIKMPDMNGLEATRLIRESNTTLPIIAQTAYAMAGDKEEALKSGFNEYLTKPIVQKELIRLLHQVQENKNHG